MWNGLTSKIHFGLFSVNLSIKQDDVPTFVYFVPAMSTSTETPSKKARTIKSMFITDIRGGEDVQYIYVYEFDQSMVPIRVWNALMVLEEKGLFNFPNVGDRGYHSLVDDVKDRKTRDEHFQEFFNVAMEDIHEWPRKESTREESMKQLGNCSWVVTLFDEWN